MLFKYQNSLDKDKFWNLGMVAITGQLTAKKIAEEVLSTHIHSEFSIFQCIHNTACETN